jgi:hypothetical protein
MTDNQFSKVEFLKLIDDCIAREDVNLLAISVEGVAPQEELIINPKDNFAAKREYYEITYDDNMRLKAKPSIGIVWAAGLESLYELMQLPGEEDEEDGHESE